MTENRKAASPTKAGTSGETASNQQANNTNKRVKCHVFGDNSASSQRSRILHHLRTTGPLTTLQARHQLDIMHPGMRVCELRKAGHPIETIWVEDFTPEGNIHRVGQYILTPGKQLSLLNLIAEVKHG